MIKRYASSVACSLFFISIFCFSSVQSQNVAITDDGVYSPNTSAMLDVYSTTKGMLIPRVSSAEKNLIVSPATGLMVFDTDKNCFYFYTGSAWTHVSSGGNTEDIWGRTGSNVYLNTNTDNVGIGTTAPNSKLEIKQNPLSVAGDTLFQVKDNLGNTVFAVFPEGVRVYIDDLSPKGSVGGFAVSGRTSSKSPLKGDYFLVTTDSCRVYIEETGGSVGGFAVSGRTSSKGITNQLLRITKDSTRVWTKDPSKGFGISDISGTAQSYMRLTPMNYFIGHLSGNLNVGGQFNSYLGYQTGMNNIVGSWNTFFGYEAGMDNTSSDNTFIGYMAGNKHINGGGNVFLGSKAGEKDLNGNQNVFIGESSGRNNLTGSSNVFIGLESGNSNTSGYSNVFLGYRAGYTNSEGWSNNFIGESAGYSNTTGTNNIFIGQNAGSANQTANGNIFVGKNSGLDNTTGHTNLFIGNKSGENNIDGCNNLFLGYSAGATHVSNHNNVFVGYEAGLNNTNGYGNTLIGTMAGRNATGSDNVL